MIETRRGGVALLLESLHEDAVALLQGGLEVVTDDGRRDSESAVPFERVVAILTRSRGRVDSRLIAACPRLAAVARAGVGLDNIDRDSLRARGIVLLSTPGANTNTTAEHTLALLLALARRVPRTAAAVIEGRWESRADYDGDELAGKTLGIVGYGAIGQRVARLAVAFDMAILVAEHGRLARGPEVVPLSALLARADVVTLHTPLTDSTRRLIGRRELAQMKRGALLVNTARGGLIDQLAVLEALASGQLGGFAADVLEVEPPPTTEALLRSPRVVITPHVASLTASTFRAMCLVAAEGVLAVSRGEAPEPRCVQP